MKPLFKVYETPKDVARAVTEEFMRKAVLAREQNQPFHVSLSGGSTPKLLFQMLAEAEVQAKIPWKSVHLFWGDERCVPPEHSESNYRMTHETLLSRVPIPEQNIHRMKGEDDPFEEMKRYQSHLREILPLDEDDFPIFDWILLGMGTDGHTASLFPQKQSLVASEALCGVAEHPESRQKRITLTQKVLNNAKEVSFLVTGADKAPILSLILNQKPGYDKYPAAQITPQNGKLLWFVDKAASSQI